MGRRSPIMHTVHTRHPRYKISNYVRGGRTAILVSPQTLYESNPYAPLEFFGETRDPNTALWIMPDGRMINGAKKPEHLWPDYSHSDVVTAYGLQSSSSEAKTWQKITGAVRMRISGETLNIELYNPPTQAQLRAIAWAKPRRGSLYVDYWSPSGKPIISSRFRNVGELNDMLELIGHR